MILEYHRPQSVEAAIELLSRERPTSFALGGGTWVSQPGEEDYAVVDLQGLDLDTVEKEGNRLLIGATTTLQKLMEYPEVQPALREAIHQEVSFNLRQVGTVAGTLVSTDGQSTFTTALMALDAHLVWLPGNRETGIGDWLPLRRHELPGILITQVIIPLQVRLAYQSVARTPDDRPVVCAAVAKWPSGRTRVVLGGFGTAPIMAMDGTESTGAEMAARGAYNHAEDDWASAEYRQETAGILVRRCLQALEES